METENYQMLSQRFLDLTISTSRLPTDDRIAVHDVLHMKITTKLTSKPLGSSMTSKDLFNIYTQMIKEKQERKSEQLSLVLKRFRSHATNGYDVLVKNLLC